ncbi:AAA family ATPase [Acidithiobacillus sp.]|uniref:nucleotide-binding protein n=1 Tax=Acidithiobacillus sp. TaxID=1872118 RepID=UPI0025C0ECFF|nr:AAA family ATPase [Acidithiobacillus sp.]
MTSSDALRIAVFNGKGGCGKTTLAWNLAMGLGRRASTLLLDADPQGSLAHWADWSGREDIAIRVREWGSEAGHGEEYAFIVTDCAPRLEAEELKQIVAESDLVLLPVLPSPLDLWASRRSADWIREQRAQRPTLRAAFVLNQVEAQSALSRAAQVAIAELGLPVLRAVLHRRAIYRSAALEGLSVYHMGKRASAAQAELERLIEEIVT